MKTQNAQEGEQIRIELQRLNIDIAAFLETRLSDEYYLFEVPSRYTVFWFGKPKGVKHDCGLWFTIRASLVGR